MSHTVETAQFILAPHITTEMLEREGFARKTVLAFKHGTPEKQEVEVLFKETNCLYENFDEGEYDWAEIWIHDGHVYWFSIYVLEYLEPYLSDLIQIGYVIKKEKEEIK